MYYSLLLSVLLVLSVLVLVSILSSSGLKSRVSAPSANLRANFPLLTTSPFSAIISSILHLVSPNQLRLSAIKWYFSQPSHLHNTTPLVYEFLLKNLVDR